MRAPVTESYPGKAEGRGDGEQGRRSRGQGADREELGEERRGETERAVNSEDGEGWMDCLLAEGKKGKSRRNQY